MRKSLATLFILSACAGICPRAGVITFTDSSSVLGIVEIRRGLQASIVDYDRDDDFEIMVWNLLTLDDQLLDNNGSVQYQDVASEMNIAGSPLYHEENGGGFADINNDLRPDVIAEASFQMSVLYNILYLNIGSSGFSEVGDEYGIRSDTQHFGASLADINNDGYIDVFMGVLPEVFTGLPGSALLFMNDAGVGFSDEATSRGLDFEGNAQAANIWWDWEDDGDMDLFVGVYFDSPSDRMRDLIYRNDGTGNFTQATGSINSSPERTVCGQLADFDRDGRLDIFILQEDTINVLWRDNGDGTFTNIAPSVNLEMDPPTPGGNPELKTDAIVADFDNDMDPDVFVTWRDLTVGAWPANQLWINEGGTFVEVGSIAGFTEEANSPSCAAGDLNSDGFLDIYVVNNNQFGTRDTLYLNDGNSNHWFEIDPVGSMSNRDAIGLKVWLTAGGVTQVQELYSTTTQPTRLHFGLASNEVVDELVLRWPRGLMETYEDLPADQVFRPLEGESFTSVVAADQWR
jgi:enediyne biosynthesis protein E4